MNYHLKNYTPSTLYAVPGVKSFKFSTKIFKDLEFDSPYIQGQYLNFWLQLIRNAKYHHTFYIEV